MLTPKLFAVLFFCLFAIAAAQVQPAKNSGSEPALPVVDDNACPFEGCSFGKWIVKKDFMLFSTWKKERTTVATAKKGQVVTGLTGVHITYEPDRIQVLRPLAELGLQPGDVLLRYMYVGEGFANIWAKGHWWKEYDCSFITESDGSGCARNCSAKVISTGRKAWWVQVKTSDGLTGWTESDDQFDCMDSLGGDAKCDALQSPSNSPR